MSRSVWYSIKRWWISRKISLIHHRREELKWIVKRELELLDVEERVAHQQLRELSSEELRRIADRSIIRRT